MNIHSLNSYDKSSSYEAVYSISSNIVSIQNLPHSTLHTLQYRFRANLRRLLLKMDKTCEDHNIYRKVGGFEDKERLSRL